MRKEDYFTKYNLPEKNCTHFICDGEICIMNPIPLRAIMEWKYISCLQIPMLGGFQRLVRKKNSRRTRKLEKSIYYAKREKPGTPVVKMYSPKDVFAFLQKHLLRLTMDLFSFDLKTNCEITMDRKIWWKKCMVEDVSNGKELLQIPAVNLVDEEIPVIDEYVLTSVFTNEKLHTKRTYVCCDCPDNCIDKLRCACFQETLKCYNPEERKLLKKDENIGYDFKRLPFARQNLSGMYECNSKCQCNEQCLNRVVQYPPKWKVQLYKDELIMEKGWGVRTLNDIPEGSFVGVYTGTMCQESKANLKCDSAEWLTAGKWKYIVNLQVLQNALKESVKFDNDADLLAKSTLAGPSKNAKPRIPKISFGLVDVSKVFQLPRDRFDDNPKHPTQSELETRNDALLASSVGNFEIFKSITLEQGIIKRKQLLEEALASNKKENGTKRPRRFLTFTSEDQSKYKFPASLSINLVRKKKMLVAKKRAAKGKVATASPQALPLPLSLTINKEHHVPKEYLSRIVKLSDVLEDIKKYKVESGPNAATPSTQNNSTFSDDNDENKPQLNNSTDSGDQDTESGEEFEIVELAKSTKFEIGMKQKAGTKQRKKRTYDLSACGTASNISGVPTKKSRLSLPLSPSKVQVSTSGLKAPVASPRKKLPKVSPLKSQAAKIKGKYSLRRGTEGKNYTYKQYDELMKLTRKNSCIQPKLKVSKDLYLVDGRKKGNIGRYFNHSCDPNLFCQYVFVDTQDVRFPVVAFFAIKNIKAGQELTWAYNYDDDIDMGIDPLECKCGSGDKCRGLLIC